MCEYCKEEVSHSAFYRRHKDGACRREGGRQNDYDMRSDSASDSDLESVYVLSSSETTDSSFCLDDDELENNDNDSASEINDDHSMDSQQVTAGDDEQIDLGTSSSESDMMKSGTLLILKVKRIQR